MSSDDQLSDGFINFQRVEKSASERTLRNYSQALAAFQTYMEESKFPGWKACNNEDFRHYLYHCMQLEMARSTIRLRFSALRSFYKYLIHRHGLAKSPLVELQMPKQERKLPTILNQTQVVELLEAPLQAELSKQAPEWLPLRDTAILELFYSAGLRLSELAKLQVQPPYHPMTAPPTTSLKKQIPSSKRHEGVSETRFKLIRFYGKDVENGEEWEFYDLQKDPAEMKSEYSNPEYAVEVKRLKKELQRLRLLYQVPADS